MTACLCTDRPQISRGCICWHTADNVRALHSVRTAFLSEANARRWLSRHNTTLGGIPLHLILDGHDLQAIVDEARKTAGHDK